MVVIEPQEDNEETLVPNPPKTKAATSSQTAPDSTKSNRAAESLAAESSSATSVNGNDSDGFETASERDVSDIEELDNEEIRNEQQDQQSPPQEVELESTQNEEELQQKALAQANDAKLEGNKLFAEGKYEEALLKYDSALQVALDVPSFAELRSICHGNRAVCFLKLEKYEDTVKECTKALELNPSYIKALIRRSEAHEKLEHLEEAIADMKKILELDPSNDHAKKAIRRLEPLAEEKREKMKEEMIAKLKDMGNSLLGRFGMSVDNFKAVKDPNTGSYSISFQR